MIIEKESLTVAFIVQNISVHAETKGVLLSHARGAKRTSIQGSLIFL